MGSRVWDVVEGTRNASVPLCFFFLWLLLLDGYAHREVGARVSLVLIRRVELHGWISDSNNHQREITPLNLDQRLKVKLTD